ncbi:MAG TPA: chemotaxis response regulator protein-glutamate methylesterase [Planctomycetaceae bacterium]|nr:chemotaxis response regulator protein-glutamate methylesterase [Planctomycetaceae bacterium]
MNRKIKVMIVDDSMVIRRILAETLVDDAAIEVVGKAANGKICLNKIESIDPDIVTLDMEMPEMDGLETLTELRKRYPKLPIIMFSTLTQQGAEATLDALHRGASDYVTKPANVGSVTAAMESVRNELIPKIKAFCPHLVAPVVKPAAPTTKTAPACAKAPGDKPNRVDIVSIGVSTGGPNALATVIPKLPADFPVPIVIVQHMPPIFTKHLADRLNRASNIEVREAQDGDEIQPGLALIAPGDYHMTLRREDTSVRMVLDQNAPENSCRPAVDPLFRCVASMYANNTLAVVLTGMGKDGERGCEPIRASGGHVIAQDEESSVVWGMPGAVTRAGLADQVLPLDKIAEELIFRTTSAGSRKLQGAVR